jgi:hypothetical protein
MRIATFNVNGGFHDLARDKAGTLAELMGPIDLYSDGSFDVSSAPLSDALTEPRRNLTLQYGRAATGVYIPASGAHPAHAMQLLTPRGKASDAFYQELLGIAVGTLLAQTNEVTAYSDCQSAIRRTRQAANPLGAVVGQLQYGQLLLAIRATTPYNHMGQGTPRAKETTRHLGYTLPWDPYGRYDCRMHCQ